jgi:hypothetical protein
MQIMLGSYDEHKDSVATTLPNCVRTWPNTVPTVSAVSLECYKDTGLWCPMVVPDNKVDDAMWYVMNNLSGWCTRRRTKKSNAPSWNLKAIMLMWV